MRAGQRGFTIIEVIIIVIVIVILAVLGSVSMIGYQQSAEDAERAEDVAIIQRGLEQYYVQGNSHVNPANGDTKGLYPGFHQMSHMFGQSSGSYPNPDTKFTPQNSSSSPYYPDVLPGVNAGALTPPRMQDQTRLRLSNESNVFSNELTQGYYIYKPLTNTAVEANYNPNTSGQCSAFSTSADPAGDRCTAYVIFYQKSDGSIQAVRSQRR